MENKENYLKELEINKKIKDENQINKIDNNEELFFNNIETNSYQIYMNKIKYQTKFMETSIYFYNKKDGLFEIPYDKILNYNSFSHNPKMKLFERFFLIMSLISINFLIDVFYLKILFSSFFFFLLVYPFFNITGDKFIFVNLKYNIDDKSSDIKKIKLSYDNEEFFQEFKKKIPNYKRFIKIFK
jgi:hypothetical protein